MQLTAVKWMTNTKTIACLMVVLHAIMDVDACGLAPVDTR